MPGTDGLTVCRELRSVSDIPIILLTAKDSELDYVMGISQGSDDYLTKPFRPTILLMKVRALLRRVEMDRGKPAAVWGFDSEVETRVTDETLRRIRKKLLQAGSTVSVSTIWGFGYKLKEAERT